MLYLAMRNLTCKHDESLVECIGVVREKSFWAIQPIVSGNFSSNKSNQAIGARTYCFVPAGSKFILQAKAVDQKDKVNLLELESSLEQLDCSIGFFQSF